MTLSVYPTSIPQVYANTLDAVSLVDQFCSCALAKKLLSTSQKVRPLVVELSDQVFGAFTKVLNHDEPGQIKSIITIPANQLVKESIADLAFELFNAAQRPQVQKIIQQAEQGEIGMDAYALSMENLEDKTSQMSDKLIERCKTEWKIPIRYPFAADVVYNRFLQEASCHADFHRQKWIEQHQDAYCIRHPQDTRSCGSDVKENLCNYQSMLKLQRELPDLYNKVMKQRICDLFPVSDETTKSNSQVVEKIREICPSVLGDCS